MVLTEYDEQLHIENERRIAEKKAEEKADMKWQKIVDEQASLLNEKDKEIARLKRLLEIRGRNE